jgi:hypothetical protein
MKLLPVLFVLLLDATASAESNLAADFRKEGERFQENCIGLKFAGCAQLIFTDHPLHITAGGLAPQNGFGLGPAFVSHYTPNETWRLFFNMDAVVTPNESWRAGAYMTAVLTRHRAIRPVSGGSGAGPSGLRIEEKPVFHVYAQSTSLNKLLYYGLGQDTSRGARSFFGMRETIVGGNVVWPVSGPLNVAIGAEVNGRAFDLRANNSVPGDSIGQVYADVTAPGLQSQPGYAQFGQNIRARPSVANGHVQFDYNVALQEWVAKQSGYSFRRFNVDLGHEFSLYGVSRSRRPRDFNGPDSCLPDPNVDTCPTISRNLEGSFGLRFLYTGSFTGTGSRVPFYLDPTLGGSDLNGNSVLASFPDYRFRAPNLMVLRGSFEHSLGKFPVGVKFMVDEGRVALKSGDLGFSHLAHSYAAGFTVHAGGLPVIELLFAWGGHEGTHTLANVSSSLLGGSARPSLY